MRGWWRGSLEWSGRFWRRGVGAAAISSRPFRSIPSGARSAPGGASGARARSRIRRAVPQRGHPGAGADRRRQGRRERFAPPRHRGRFEAARRPRAAQGPAPRLPAAVGRERWPAGLHGLRSKPRRRGAVLAALGQSGGVGDDRRSHERPRAGSDHGFPDLATAIANCPAEGQIVTEIIGFGTITCVECAGGRAYSPATRTCVSCPGGDLLYRGHTVRDRPRFLAGFAPGVTPDQVRCTTCQATTQPDRDTRVMPFVASADGTICSRCTAGSQPSSCLTDEDCLVYGWDPRIS